MHPDYQKFSYTDSNNTMKNKKNTRDKTSSYTLPEEIKKAQAFIQKYTKITTDEEGKYQVVWKVDFKSLEHLNDIMDQINGNPAKEIVGMSDEDLANIMICSKEISDNIINRVLQGAFNALISINSETISEAESNLKANTMGLIAKIVNIRQNITTYLDKNIDVTKMRHGYRAMENIYNVVTTTLEDGKKIYKVVTTPIYDLQTIDKKKQEIEARKKTLLEWPFRIFSSIKTNLVAMLVLHIKTDNDELKKYLEFPVELLGVDNSGVYSVLKMSIKLLKNNQSEDPVISTSDLNSILYDAIKYVDESENFSTKVLYEYNEEFKGYKIDEIKKEKIITNDRDLSGLIFHASEFIKAIKNNKVIKNNKIIENNNLADMLKAYSYLQALEELYEGKCLSEELLELLTKTMRSKLSELQYQDIINMKKSLGSITEEIQSNEEALLVRMVKDMHKHMKLCLDSIKAEEIKTESNENELLVQIKTHVDEMHKNMTKDLDIIIEKKTQSHEDGLPVQIKTHVNEMHKNMAEYLDSIIKGTQSNEDDLSVQIAKIQKNMTKYLDSIVEEKNFHEDDLPVQVIMHVNKMHKLAAEYYESWYVEYVDIKYNLKKSIISPICSGSLTLFLGAAVCFITLVAEIKNTILSNEQNILYGLINYVNQQPRIETSVGAIVLTTVLSAVVIAGVAMAVECFIRYLITREEINKTVQAEEGRVI